MKILRTLITSLSFIIVSSIQMHAQEEECASDLIHKQLLESNSDYFNKNQILENGVNEIINNQTNRLNPNVVYTIPVVVHVIHLGEPIGTGTNISDAQITDAIENLNSRWRNDNANGVDIQIQFCLASRDPNGYATSGINRVNAAGIPNYIDHGISMIYSNCDAPSETTIKDLSKWPVSAYYNIWVVNKICQNFGGFAGVANYPNGNAYDGTVIKYTSMNGTSVVLAHELGHGFNLYHTFEGDGGNVSCPLDTTCSSNGDRVCDTPPHKQGDCSTANPCSTAGVWSSSLNNYMSYCNNRFKFTQGQKDRIRASAIVYPRLSLLSSVGCSALGINDNELGKFSIFPNPAHNQITLQFANTTTGKIQIFDIIGKKIMEQDVRNPTLIINVDSFTAGVYLVKFSNNEIITTHKLIVDKK